MPIVAEIKQISDRQNSFLKSKAQIPDGSGRRFLTVRRKRLASLDQCVVMLQNNRVGVGEYCGAKTGSAAYQLALLKRHKSCDSRQPRNDIFACMHKYANMRTTLDFPDDLYRSLKARAALSGVPVREIVT